MKKLVIILAPLVPIVFIWLALRGNGQSSQNQIGTEKIIIGVPNWPSVQAKAHIIKNIIENNLGLQVELQTASNAVIYEGMDKGTIHLHPETWSPNHDGWINQYVNQKRSVKGSAGEKSIVRQRICVTEGSARRTKIEHLTELTDPKMAKQFDSDGDGKGEIWIGAVGWGSTLVEKIRAKSYGYDVTMKLKTMEEPLAMAEINTAIAKKQNIVFFCSVPHHIFILHKLRTLKEPPHDPVQWRIITPTKDPDWLEKSRADVAWKNAQVGSHYAVSLEKSHPPVAKLFSHMGFNSKDAIDMSYQLMLKKISPEQYAKMWIDKNSARVDSWLR